LIAPSIGPCGAADLGFLGLAALGILLDIALVADGFAGSNPICPASQSVSNASQMTVAHVIKGLG
jgi:hypothetical protein